MKNVSISAFVILFLAAGIFTSPTHGQIVIDQRRGGGWVNEYEAGTRIDSLVQLPTNIKVILKGIMNERLPKYFYDKLTFIEGIHYNLSEYFRFTNHENNTPVQALSGSLFPAYDLRFIFSDKEFKIQRYNVILHLDDFGQVIGINLPNAKNKYNTIFERPIPSIIKPSKSKEEYVIKPLTQAVEIARKTAELSNYKTDSCEVDLRYDKNDDVLLWVVKFVQKIRNHSTDYHYYEIEVTSLSIKSSYDSVIVRY